MDRKASEALDRHITGNYGEGQYPLDSEGMPTLYVTKTVAAIVPDDNGTLHPYEAAFVAIAKDDSEGRYEFTYRGQRTVVTVERPNNEGE